VALVRIAIFAGEAIDLAGSSSPSREVGNPAIQQFPMQ
jgi:hypothetical protein